MKNNIKRLRLKLGVSQVALAEKINVSQQCITKWETGEAMPRADKLVPLARELGCTVDDLLHDTPGEGE